MNSVTVFRKIQEISRQTADGRPPVSIERLCSELQINREAALNFLDEIKIKQLIRYYDITPTAIQLTEIGQHAVL